jgi:hypothetical protein
LPSTHQLLKKVQPLFEESRRSEPGYLRPKKRRLPDIYVSRDQLPRALDAANKLFLALEREGYRVAYAPTDRSYYRQSLDEREKEKGDRYQRDGWGPCRATVVSVGTVLFGLTLYELSEHVEVEYSKGGYVRISEKERARKQRLRGRFGSDWTHMEDLPSGRLALKAYSGYSGTTWERTWAEKKPGEIDAWAARIIRKLKAAAPAVAKQVEEARHRAEVRHQKWLEEKAEREKRETAQRRLDAQAASREGLLKAIDSWAAARKIEDFFADVEVRITGLDEADRAVASERLALAREMVGEVDALAALRRWMSPEELFESEDGSWWSKWRYRH